MTSPFLGRPESDWIASNELAFAIRDRFPVSPGHSLVVPKRLVPDWFDATREERTALLELVEVVERELDGGAPAPDGYNIGINSGAAAGRDISPLLGKPAGPGRKIQPSGYDAVTDSNQCLCYVFHPRCIDE